jgi:hypothetical protein
MTVGAVVGAVTWSKAVGAAEGVAVTVGAAVGAVTWSKAVGAADVGVATPKDSVGTVAADVTAVEAVETLLYRTVPAMRPMAVPPRTAVWVRRRFTKRS